MRALHQRVAFAVIAGLVLFAGCSSGKGEGEMCGGSSGMVCADEFYCSYPDYGCGTKSATGTCVIRDDSCPRNMDAPQISNVCGCDGHVYQSACEAHRVKQDVGLVSLCSLNFNQVPCGDILICDTDYGHCDKDVSGGSDKGASFHCAF